MIDVAVLVFALLIVIFVAGRASMTIAAGTYLRRGRRNPAWFDQLEHHIPSWRLFGQSTGSFDARIGVSDWRLDTPHIRDNHVTERDEWRLRQVFAHPSVRLRMARQICARVAIAAQRARRAPTALERAYTTALVRDAAELVWQHHPDDGASRSFELLVIVDQGFYATSEPMAAARFGPFRTSDVIGTHR